VGPRTGAENLAPPTGIRSPDRPARSESLYQLSYPANLYFINTTAESQNKTNLNHDVEKKNPWQNLSIISKT